jgi:hypothetical protein
MDWCRENLNTGIHGFLHVRTPPMIGGSGSDFPTNPMNGDHPQLVFAAVPDESLFPIRRIAESHGFE